VAIEIRLEDERGAQLSALGDTRNVLGRLNRARASSVIAWKLFQYIDPYGDTVFNVLQVDDLMHDIQSAIKEAESSEDVDFLIALTRLVSKLESGLLLRFYGD
jgi:hypothetical protein